MYRSFHIVIIDEGKNSMPKKVFYLIKNCAILLKKGKEFIKMLCDYYENDEVGQLIRDLDEYNREALKLLENDDLDTFNHLIHEFRKLQLNQCPAYQRAVIARHFLDKRYIINFFQDFDVTPYIDEIVRTRSDEYKDSEFYYIQDEINGDLEDRLNCIQACLNGEKTVYTEPYNDYMKLLDKLHSFQYDNSLGALDNAKKFRSLVKELASQKRKCMPVFVLPREDMQQATLAQLKKIDNFEEAMDLTMELANQIKDVKKGNAYYDSDYWIDNTNEGDCLYSSGNRVKIDFFSNAMINMGIPKKQYDSYFKTEDKERLYRPSKKLVLGLALYLEIPLPKKTKNFELKTNIERFMNMHSYSLASPFETLGDGDELLDDDILLLIDAGLDIKVISYFMKNFAAKGIR